MRGFICTTSHPAGCAANVREQIAYVRKQGPIADVPKRVAVLGCSTGYGLASRIVATFAGGADTIGVSFERDPTEKRPATAGWYNNRAFEIEATAIGRAPVTLEGDAFSDEMKAKFIAAVREKFGQLDLLVYSMAAPTRTDPDTGVVHRSAIKPLGAPVEIKTLNTETGEVYETTIQPASEDEATATVAVMGGDDWKRWIDPDAARVVALKAVVTQASSAIPVVPLYGTVLFKVMKEMGLHEGCIEQIDRLFRTQLGPDAKLDDEKRLRVDDWELSPQVQAEVMRRWPLLSTETMDELADLPDFRREFLRLFGFGIDGVDYDKDVDPRALPA